MTEYTPTVSDEYAERIRRWHENAYRMSRDEAGDGDQTFEYLGRTIVVPPQVMPITAVSQLLGEAVLAEVREADRVLDMGTGSGVNAILAASKSTDVVAVDVNPVAVEAARANAARNGVADRVDVRVSDVYAEVSGEFELLIFDGSSGHLGHLRGLFDEQGFAAEVIATDSVVKDGWRVDYFTFRLTP